MDLLNFQVILLLFCVSKLIQSQNDDAYESHFGTKTPYRVMANLNDIKVTFPGCTPVKIWYAIRHGTRTPTENSLRDMKKYLPGLTNRIIESNEHNPNVNTASLKNWKIEYNETVLTEEGEKELQTLAKRMQKRFPSLFPGTFSNSSYLFRCTNTQRTIASARNFALGLFGSDIENVYFPKSVTLDPVLRFYKLCKRWKMEVEAKPAMEQKKFYNCTIMVEQIEAMSKALNLTKNLTVDELHAMFQMCCIERANLKESVWCSLLPMDVIKMMEFSQILLYEHKTGYVNDVSYKQACPMLRHMVQYLGQNPNKLEATIMLTHDTAILTFLAHLGLYKNEKNLEHTDFNSDFENKWKLSEIGTFATNIAFVLFRCTDELKVAVFHQERLVRLPNCGDLCSFKYIKDHFYESIHNCRLNEICNV